MDPGRLSRLRVFSSLSDEAVARIARWAQEVEVAEGTPIVREGRPAYEFFVVEEGNAEVTHEGEHVADLGPGDFFGEIALLETGLRTATVTARSLLKLIAIYGPPFRQLERELPEFPRQIRAGISDRLWPR